MMLRFCALFLVSTLLGLSASAQLVSQGVSDYQIYSSAQATETERYAARELQHYIAQVSGATLPIVHEVAPDAKLIYVGFDDVPKALLGDLKPDTFGKEEYIIRESHGALLIAGGQPRGTLYGVIGFLQDHLGCRWYTSDVIKIPKKKSIGIKGIEDRQAPVFEYREAWYREAYATEFAVHNRLNPSGVPLPEDKGGSFIIYPFVHTFNTLVPLEKYFDEHPEYYSLVDGVRQNKHIGAQLCLTNPEVVRIATESVLRWIEEHPEADVFSVDQNDGFGFCECESCAALDEVEGSQSGTVLTFVNQIAEVVAQKHPEVQLQTLAYVYSEVPPKTIKPRDNVTIRMCHYNYCEAHAIGQCDDHDRFVERLEGWSKITDSITIWDYYTTFRHYLSPFPNFESVINHPRFYADRNCIGLFAQGNNVRQQGGGEFSGLRAWVFAQLMWNPHQDGWKLINEYVKNVYGPASPFITHYIRMAHNAVKGPENTFSIFSHPANMRFLSPEFLEQAESLLVQAERAAKDDPALLKRVELAHLPIHYVRLYFYTIGGHRYLSADEMPEVLAKFERIMKENNIEQLSEVGGHQELTDFIALVKAGYEFIADWWIIGPFDNAERKGFDRVYPPEKGFDATQHYAGIDQQVQWREYDNTQSGYIDFAVLMTPAEEGVAYAYRTFEVEVDTEMEVGIGSNDGVKLWVNGELVLNKKVAHVALPNQEILTLSLKRGSNTVLVKIDQLGGGWGFYFTQR